MSARPEVGHDGQPGALGDDRRLGDLERRRAAVAALRARMVPRGLAMGSDQVDRKPVAPRLGHDLEGRLGELLAQLVVDAQQLVRARVLERRGCVRAAQARTAASGSRGGAPRVVSPAPSISTSAASIPSALVPEMRPTMRRGLTVRSARNRVSGSPLIAVTPRAPRGDCRRGPRDARRAFAASSAEPVHHERHVGSPARSPGQGARAGSGGSPVSSPIMRSARARSFRLEGRRSTIRLP